MKGLNTIQMKNEKLKNPPTRGEGLYNLIG